MRIQIFCIFILMIIFARGTLAATGCGSLIDSRSAQKTGSDSSNVACSILLKEELNWLSEKDERVAYCGCLNNSASAKEENKKKFKGAVLKLRDLSIVDKFDKLKDKSKTLMKLLYPVKKLSNRKEYFKSVDKIADNCSSAKIDLKKLLEASKEGSLCNDFAKKKLKNILQIDETIGTEDNDYSYESGREILIKYLGLVKDGKKLTKEQKKELKAVVKNNPIFLSLRKSIELISDPVALIMSFLKLKDKNKEDIKAQIDLYIRKHVDNIPKSCKEINNNLEDLCLELRCKSFDFRRIEKLLKKDKDLRPELMNIIGCSLMITDERSREKFIDNDSAVFVQNMLNGNSADLDQKLCKKGRSRGRLGDNTPGGNWGGNGVPEVQPKPMDPNIKPTDPDIKPNPEADEVEIKPNPEADEADENNPSPGSDISTSNERIKPSKKEQKDYVTEVTRVPNPIGKNEMAQRQIFANINTGLERLATENTALTIPIAKKRVKTYNPNPAFIIP